MKPLFKTLKFIFINIAVILTLFLALEFGVRAYAHLFVEGKTFFRDSTFTSPWITSYDFPPPLIDANGNGIFRHKAEPVPMEKPSNIIRIIALGGSTTLNQRPFAHAGIDYSIVLEDLLNKNNMKKQYQVLNAGSDAYSSAQSLINLQFRLIEFQPDIVILMHNINDLTANYFNEGATADYGNKYLLPYFLNPELQASHSFTGLLFQSRLLTKLGLPKLLASRRSIDYTNSIKPGEEYFERNLSHIAMVCRENNIQLVLLTQPNNMKKFNHDAEENHILKYNYIVKKVAQNNNTGFVDMFSLMGNNDIYFIDPVHYTPDGIKRFAELLAPAVKKISNQEN